MQEDGMSYAQIANHSRATAKDHLIAAVSAIDDVMGPGSAQANPALVVALMSAAAQDYHASMLSHRVVPALDRIADALLACADRLPADE
jgi:hypothetical protein